MREKWLKRLRNRKWRKQRMIEKDNKFIDLKGANSTMKLGFAIYAGMVTVLVLGACICYAAGDPISTVNKLSEFIFSLIRAIGLILLGLGIMQVGLSLKSHDPSQRANVRPRWVL